MKIYYKKEITTLEELIDIVKSENEVKVFVMDDWEGRGWIAVESENHPVPHITIKGTKEQPTPQDAS